KLSELTTILYQTLIKEANRIGKDINIFVEIEDDFSTKKHYYLMSVLRNLIVNSIEAIPKDSRGEIHLSHRRHDDKNVFIVKDNGIGIKASEINEIFNPGYSTKINYETGEISRGLGLAIVKKIVEEELKGEIHVNSDIQYGTEISIAIKREELEV
ncbi:ATP-binding protein, partial [Vibrio parahaemolyticus]|nr:ATP-binding protein [Vibrio parahaemolyticus]